jgi:hypothetical protein
MVARPVLVLVLVVSNVVSSMVISFDQVVVGGVPWDDRGGTHRAAFVNAPARLAKGS